LPQEKYQRFRSVLLEELGLQFGFRLSMDELLGGTIRMGSFNLRQASAMSGVESS
jgi:hypothetical protein